VRRIWWAMMSELASAPSGPNPTSYSITSRTIVPLTPLRVSGRNSVPVMPSLEWAPLLYVGEVMVPFELSDAGDPLRA